MMLPWVALFGLNANEVILGAVCAAVAITAAYILFERMGISGSLRIWLVLFFGAGTVMWWCTAFGAVWMLAHVAGAMFGVLVLVESYGRRRGWLIGFLIACATLCRFPMLLSILPIAYWLMSDAEKPMRRIQSLALGFVPLLVLYGFYNYLRWHTFADIGYTVWYHEDQVGEPTGSPFKLKYLPFNLYSFFVLPPEYQQQFPWLKPTSFGIALTFTSPALIWAFFAGIRTRETLVWWTATILTALPSLLYYVNGFEQFGMRHSLDFTPFLLPLVARGLQRFRHALAFGLIVFSVAANAFGVWYSWHYHGFSVVPR